MGAMAALVVLLSFAAPRTSLAEYATIRGAMGAIATWMLLPALALTLIAGLLAIALNHAYHNAGWVGAKLATGVIIFEGALSIQSSMLEEAGRSANALAGQVEPTAPAGSLGAEQITLLVLLVVATANVGLGIWRPRLTRIPD